MSDEDLFYWDDYLDDTYDRYGGPTDTVPQGPFCDTCGRSACPGLHGGKCEDLFGSSEDLDDGEEDQEHHGKEKIGPEIRKFKKTEGEQDR